MTPTKNRPPAANRKGGGHEESGDSNGIIVTKITLRNKGLEIPGRHYVVAPPLPERTEGDIKGWSANSRRRMRKAMMRLEPPEGWHAWEATLTIPALPSGHPSPCIDLAGARDLWERLVRWMAKRQVCCFWRLEVQPRSNTARADIRGIPQPHWHLIGASEDAAFTEKLRDCWLRLLGPRGEVWGADERAASASVCEGWSNAQLRYLHDHASKAKAAQVAEGWGRHWGIVGRRHFRGAVAKDEGLTARQHIELARLLRRYCSRRVPDLRNTAGIPWQTCEREILRRGTWARWRWMGGSSEIWCPGWDGRGLPSLADQRRIARDLGKQRQLTWGLRLAPCKRRMAGQWFIGNAGARLVEWVKTAFPDYADS